MYDRSSKKGVVAEIKRLETATDIFKNVRKLKGISVIVERDLNADRKADKQVLLYIKQEILGQDKSTRIYVQDDRIRIGDKWAKFGKNKELLCGDQKFANVLTNFYGSKLRTKNFNYFEVQKLLKENRTQKN